jgi:hypothetical protein
MKAEVYNGEFTQCLEITVTHEDHDACLYFFNLLKKQCDAWAFNVKYQESKSARKGPVLARTLMIYQTAYAGDILIFKEAIRRICYHLEIYHNAVSFRDRGTEPVNALRQLEF